MNNQLLIFLSLYWLIKPASRELRAESGKFSQKKKPRGNCAISAFWTAGFTARPLAIGSTSLPQYSRYQIEKLGVF
jgi:hypothetical protein